MAMDALTATSMVTMPIDAKLLTLTQWLSPSFPVGAFAYSHGIEQAIADEWITNGDDLEAWLKACLRHGSARSDAIWVRLAYHTDDPSEINGFARAYAASRERVFEAERQGAAFVATTNAVWGFEIPPLMLPVAIGCAAAKAGLDEDTTALLYLQSFIGNLTSAAMRLMPLGQTEGQRVQAALQPICIAVIKDTQGATLDDVGTSTFLSDIAAMRHETLQPRLFQS